MTNLIKHIKKTNLETKEIIGLIFFIFLFLLGIFLANNFNAQIIKYLGFGHIGMIVYIISGITATVIAPMSSVPLMPIANVLWGPFITSILSIFSWTIGALFSFVIARYFGRNFVSKFVNLKTVHKYEAVLGENNLFWNIVFLRMALPVDVLSYAIGFFSSIKISTYLLATIVGITPFAFIMSYAIQGSVVFQLLAILLIIIIVYSGYRKLKKVSLEDVILGK